MSEADGFTLTVDRDGITVCIDPHGGAGAVFRVDRERNLSPRCDPRLFGYAIATVESVGRWATCQAVDVSDLLALGRELEPTA